MTSVAKLIDRQDDIANGVAAPLGLPKFDTYAICNLRGGDRKDFSSF